jgi:hypothetical protein
MENLTTLGVPENFSRNAQKLYTDISTSELVKLEQFLSTSEVKQGVNLAPVLFIFVIHAVSPRQEMGFHNS